MRTLVVTALWHRYPQSLESILAVAPVGGPLDYLMLAHDDPYHGDAMSGYKNLTRKLNHARDVFLTSDAEQMLLVEDDMIVPPDALASLMEADADVAYGLTCWRHGKPGWSARLRLDGHGIVANLSDHPDRARAMWGHVIDVAGVGTFCTLIQRRVMEALAFRLDASLPVCCDWWLAVDCQRYDFTQRADLGVVCGHITPDPTPRVIWPDAKERRLWRMESLPSTSARATTWPACQPAT